MAVGLLVASLLALTVDAVLGGRIVTWVAIGVILGVIITNRVPAPACWMLPFVGFVPAILLRSGPLAAATLAAISVGQIGMFLTPSADVD